MPPTAALSENGMMVRRYDRERFVTALFAPPFPREDLFTLYGFNIEIARIRETVREPMLGQIRLHWWREALDALWRGDPVGHPVGDALGDLLKRQSLPRPLFDRLLDARELDMQDRPPATLPDLQTYVDNSAAGLSALAALLLGAERPEAQEAARQVGQAWGLIGLLRAHAFHIKLRRLSLPLSLLVEQGLDAEELLSGAAPPGLAVLAEQVADLAMAHLRQARRLRRAVPRSVLPVLLLARLADGYAASLRRTGYNLLDRGWSKVNSRPLALLAAHGLGRF